MLEYTGCANATAWGTPNSRGLHMPGFAVSCCYTRLAVGVAPACGCALAFACLHAACLRISSYWSSLGMSESACFLAGGCVWGGGAYKLAG